MDGWIKLLLDSKSKQLLLLLLLFLLLCNDRKVGTIFTPCSQRPETVTYRPA